MTQGLVKFVLSTAAVALTNSLAVRVSTPARIARQLEGRHSGFADVEHTLPARS
jgi:hypothetical protein